MSNLRKGGAAMPILGVYTSTDWEYYHISNAMQYSNTTLETTSLAMYDFNTVFYVVPLFPMAL